MSTLTPELAVLFNQLLGDREAIADAREKLARAEASYWETSERIRKALESNTRKAA